MAKQKDDTTAHIQETAELFRSLARLLSEEATAYEAKGTECLAAWDATNRAVDATKKGALRRQDAEIANLSPQSAAPVASHTAPAAWEAKDFPTIRPMVGLPNITLPEDEGMLHACAAVLLVQQHMDQQNAEVKEAYPLTWGQLDQAGLKSEHFDEIVPADLLTEEAPLREGEVSGRQTGVL